MQQSWSNPSTLLEAHSMAAQLLVKISEAGLDLSSVTVFDNYYANAVLVITKPARHCSLRKCGNKFESISKTTAQADRLVKVVINHFENHPVWFGPIIKDLLKNLSKTEYRSEAADFDFLPPPCNICGIKLD